MEVRKHGRTICEVRSFGAKSRWNALCIQNARLGWKAFLMSMETVFKEDKYPHEKHKVSIPQINFRAGPQIQHSEEDIWRMAVVCVGLMSKLVIHRQRWSLKYKVGLQCNAIFRPLGDDRALLFRASETKANRICYRGIVMLQRWSREIKTFDPSP